MPSYVRHTLRYELAHTLTMCQYVHSYQDEAPCVLRTDRTPLVRCNGVGDQHAPLRAGTSAYARTRAFGAPFVPPTSLFVSSSIIQRPARMEVRHERRKGLCGLRSAYTSARCWCGGLASRASSLELLSFGLLHAVRRRPLLRYPLHSDNLLAA